MHLSYLSYIYTINLNDNNNNIISFYLKLLLIDYKAFIFLFYNQNISLDLGNRSDFLIFFFSFFSLLLFFLLIKYSI